MRFVLHNAGTSASPLTEQLTSEVLGRVATAIEVQLNAHVSPEWGGNYAVRVSADGKDILPGEIAFALVDALPDEPGAIAYHATDGTAVPVCFLALTQCKTIDDATAGISHECCETAGDPGCNLWAADGAGTYFANELSDPVESTSYPVDLGDGGPPVMVSDFVLRSFFSIGGQAPYSYASAHGTATAPTAPFNTAPGGYQVTFKFVGEEQQIWGQRDNAFHAERMRHWSSRSFRRTQDAALVLATRRTAA